MNSRKNVIVTLLAVLLVAAVSVSAGGGDKAEKMAKLKAEYNLSDAQVAQLEQQFDALKPIADRAMAIKTELKALEGAANPDTRAINAKKTELDGVKKEYKAKVTAAFRSVLTREQFARWEAKQAEYEKSHSAKK
jgi:Spy/CpxP family protein refolding chaperone